MIYSGGVFAPDDLLVIKSSIEGDLLAVFINKFDVKLSIGNNTGNLVLDVPTGLRRNSTSLFDFEGELKRGGLAGFIALNSSSGELVVSRSELGTFLLGRGLL